MDRHNESTLALPMVTRMRIMETHTRVSHAIYTRTYTNTCARAHVLHVCCVCRGRIDREAKRVRGTSSQPRYRTNCLENNGKRTPHREWMNIQGLSNDWVSQKSGLLSTRDSSLQAHEMECKFN